MRTTHTLNYEVDGIELVLYVVTDEHLRIVQASECIDWLEVEEIDKNRTVILLEQIYKSENTDTTTEVDKMTAYKIWSRNI